MTKRKSKWTMDLSEKEEAKVNMALCLQQGVYQAEKGAGEEMMPVKQQQGPKYKECFFHFLVQYSLTGNFLATVRFFYS